MLCKLFGDYLQVNAMQIIDQQQRILKTIMTNFSYQEKYIYIKNSTIWQG